VIEIVFNYPVAFEDLSHFMGAADGFSQASIQAFEDKTARDFETIKNWYPSKIDSILDIGCGLGSVNILLAQDWLYLREINIIDGDGTVDKRTSFSEDTQAWSDRKLARDFIKSNVSYRCNVLDHPPDPSLTIHADLIISLKSWGHHYPVSVYLDLVKRSLLPGGRIVMDIRRRRGDGLRAMEEGGFQYLATTYETPKCERMVFCRA
jgi:SAM-dependent methyltransferase